MRLIKAIISLFFCLLWIIVTNYKSAPLNSLGALLTYQSGLLSIPTDEQIISSTNRDLVIKIDHFGIPYIFSETDKDVAFGLGFMHAKDRYFQMELMSKMVKGELAGMFGPRAIPSDEFWKPYEFDQKASEILVEYEKNAPQLYAYLVNYSEGVNAYLENNTLNDPLYTLFDANPQIWKPEYCLMVTWYMSKNLAYYDLHSERQELLDQLPSEVLNILYPMSPNDIKTILPSKIIAETNATLPQPLEKVKLGSKIKSKEQNTDIGSNNWAINSQKTKNGTTLVANDPHLFITLPNSFYEANLMGDKIQVYGYTIPGVPLIVSGHNTTIAWGITNGEWDLTDRYLLETKADSVYLLDGKWIPFEEDEYTIEVKGKGTEQIKIKRTVHGNLIQEKDQYFAQKWHPSEKSYSVKALFEMMQASHWGSFKDALNNYDYPPQNFIYGDVNDTIGIVCAGKLPTKPKGYEGGLLDGTKAPLSNEYVSTQWETKNPEHLYLFSANQLPIQNGQYFGMHWHKDDYRVNHIDRLLKAKDDWTVQSIQEMQLDEVDLSFFHLKDFFQFHPLDSRYDHITRLFEKWDGKMNTNSNAAYLYEHLRMSVEAEAKRYAQEVLQVQQAPSMKSFLNYLSQDTLSLQATVLANILARTDSLLSMEEFAQKTYSETSDFFAYNLSFLPGFGHQIKDVGGNKNTINMNAKAHPVFRSIYEMEKDQIKGYTSLAGGQSGKMNAKHYSDQMDNWREGTYKSTQFTDDPTQLHHIINTLNFK